MAAVTTSYGLAVVSRQVNGIPAVIADGDVDVVTAPALARHLATNLSGPPPPPVMLVDLRGVDFLSAAGLNLLAAADKQAAESRTDLRLIANTHPVVRALTVSGLHHTLSVYETEAAALAA